LKIVIIMYDRSLILRSLYIAIKKAQNLSLVISSLNLCPSLRQTQATNLRDNLKF
jgi:hypothetical protein